MLALQKGNKASFEALMRKYYGRIFNFILRLVKRREMAEDLAQEVFLKIYHQTEAYHPPAKFQTWIFTLAKNLALTKDKKFLPTDENFFQEAIHSLPEDQRIAVLLLRYEKFSYEEIAESLDCSLETVKSLLSRAKETLKKELGKSQ